MRDASAVVALGDGTLPVLHHWLNAMGLQSAVPTLHVELSGTDATIGPLVLPADGACYLCWRMRALACADDFADAMALEEELAAKRPPVADGPVSPALVPMIAEFLVAELLALRTRSSQPRLSGAVLTVDGRTESQVLHPLLARPDCPACSGHGRRPLEASPERGGSGIAVTDFDGIARRTVDPVCGMIRALDLIPAHVQEPELPYVVRAQLANARFSTDEYSFAVCEGKAWTEQEARDGALGEALERYAAMTWQPRQRISSTYDGLDGPGLHPQDLVLFADWQYDTLPFHRWQPESQLEWVPAQSLVNGTKVWIPLLATHLNYHPPPGAALFQPTSSGFAAGPDRSCATARALLEVIERDAFMIAWSHRLPGRRVAAAQVPDEQIRGLAASYADRGVELMVHLLPTDTVAAVVLAIAWSDRLPAATIGLGAALDPLAAARSAVLEVGQARSALQTRLAYSDVRARLDELSAAPAEALSLEDHDLVYAAPAAAAARMRFLREARLEPWPDLTPQSDAAGNELEVLTRSLAEVAPDVLAVDVTPRDVAGLGVSVVRGLVPGFVPIWFGAKGARLGGRRLLEMPSRIGLRQRPALLDELNLDPHPLA
ncbi:TOMM precursor leader peptide-binding protein [Kribbella sp. VKM Ac-2568]|uniref:TOMM precursor leader peptide-binding protein n=1 Tax=Kribbella sp. VKM Ac-2568 TaxID=2512219 RepID=UPI00130517BC|nr:TOMM precursor leader peptide-binding protein [Kribbella sp. VKM Ac-2568]